MGPKCDYSVFILLRHYYESSVIVVTGNNIPTSDDLFAAGEGGAPYKLKQNAIYLSSD